MKGTDALWDDKHRTDKGDMITKEIGRSLTLDATPLGPVCAEIAEEVFLTMGLCLSIELMIINAASVQSSQLGVFAGQWLSTSSHGLLPLHDFTINITTTCTYTPECNVRWAKKFCVVEESETHNVHFALLNVSSSQVIAVMLIIRLLLYHPHVNLTWSISKRLFLIAVLVAQKFWDDYPLRNIDFTTAWSRVAPNEAPLTIKDVNSLECILLGALGFDLFVHVHQYHSFCNELFASVHHRQAQDGGQVANLMQHHAMLLQKRKIKCWYVR
mmetsp:Transcript_9358/g.28634  ORF Transcript_9358/g.28634 Transcript_9358/m.28634 type:complete len:271 (+) Transcript_9358:298-1110(+)